MTQNELLELANQRIDSLLSSGELYQTVFNESAKAFEQYAETHTDDSGLSRRIDFMDESVFKNAIRISVEETIKLLCEQNLIALPRTNIRCKTFI